MIKNYKKLLKVYQFLIIILSCNVNYIISDNGFNNVNERRQVTSRQPEIISKIVYTPEEIMVDITNKLAFNILHLHSSATNLNNFAFSPCGLGSVMIALYEATNTKNSIQILKALNFPWDRDLIRIGYRDIHRKLRSYYYKDENLLSGLSLSKENITINSYYESILRFYGYDLDSTNNMLVKNMENLNATERRIEETNPSNEPTTLNNQINEIPDSSKNTENIDEITSPVPNSITIPLIATLPSTTTMTTTELSTNATTLPTTSTTSTTTTSRSTTTTTTTELPITSTILTTSSDTTEQLMTIVNPMFDQELTTTQISTRNGIITETIPPPVTILPRTTMYIFTFKPVQTTIPPSVPTEIPNTIFKKQLVTMIPTTMMPTLTPIPKIDLRSRFKRSYNAENVPYFQIPEETAGIDEYNRNNYKNFYNNVPEVTSSSPLSLSTGRPSSSAQQFLSYDYPSVFTNNYDETFTDKNDKNNLFYINSYQNVKVNYKLYDTILRTTIIPNIHSTILELPLDSANYNLLIFLPNYGYEVNDVIEQLKSQSSISLREIKQTLEHKWIKATIPNFQLKGNVVLTSDLMKMGIINIFEPSLADFSGMTDELGIYTKHIEQSLSINIKTHSQNQLKRYAKYFSNPIEISVNQPFIFLIMDIELNLAIMAGKIVNPINSRII